MPKIAVVVLTEKDVKLVEETLAAAHSHMPPAKKNTTQTILGKIKKAQRVMV